MAKTSKKSMKKLTSEDIALEAISMTQQGYSYSEVAKALNIDISKVYNAVYYYKRKTNVPARSYTKSSSSISSKKVMKSSKKSSSMNTMINDNSMNKMSFMSWIKSFFMTPINYFTSMFSK